MTMTLWSPPESCRRCSLIAARGRALEIYGWNLLWQMFSGMKLSSAPIAIQFPSFFGAESIGSAHQLKRKIWTPDRRCDCLGQGCCIRNCAKLNQNADALFLGDAINFSFPKWLHQEWWRSFQSKYLKFPPTESRRKHNELICLPSWRWCNDSMSLYLSEES